MSNKITAAQWRERAEETRVLAEGMVSEEARRDMLEIARQYDKLAEHAERQRNLDTGPRAARARRSSDAR
jgi:hypothetical protein